MMDMYLKKPEPRPVREWRMHLSYYRKLLDSAEDTRQELCFRLEEIENKLDELDYTLEEIEGDLDTLSKSGMMENPVDTRLWMLRKEEKEENNVGAKDTDSYGEEGLPF
jgi:chromosome segregation ATPase